MTSERQHRHASSTSASADDDLDAAPGRTSRSSLLQRKADANGVAPDADSAVAAAATSTGASLPAMIMRKFEGSLGADLSSVRVHTGGESAAAAAAVGAKAYTVGQDIHFGAGQFDPSSPAGQHLLAHEVAHTVQQRGGTPTRQHKLEVSSPHDAAEHEADRAADAMVGGQPAAIASAPETTARKVFRDATKHNNANTKLSFDIHEAKLGERPLGWVTLSSTFKAKGSLELQNVEDGKAVSSTFTAGTAGVAGQGASGAKVEANLAEQQFKQQLTEGVTLNEKLKEKFSFELSREKLDVGVGLEARAFCSKVPWLQGAGDLNFKFASVKWKDLQSDPKGIDKAKILAVEGGLGLNGEGTLMFDDMAYKGSVTSQVFVAAAPNWAKIGGEVAKEAAKQGAKTAATSGGTAAGGSAATAGGATATGGSATVTGGATATGAGATAAGGEIAMCNAVAIGTAAAAIALPAAFAALAVAGTLQMEKNQRATMAANAAGLKLREEGQGYIRSYMTTIRGGQGSGQGALDANVKVMEYMAATDKNRADACADIVQKNGGVDGLTAAVTRTFRDEAYAKSVAEFERRFAAQFGLVEGVGETWGMRGQFRNDLRRFLYRDD